MKIFFIVCICAMLSGCASSATITRGDTGLVDKITVTGQLKASVKTEGEEITIDSKNEPLIKDLVSINAFKEK